MNDSPLTIVITDPHLKGGGQVRYVTNLTREFVRLGHRVIVCCKAGSVIAPATAQAGADVRGTFIFKGGLRPGAWGADLRALRRILRDERPAIVHVNGSQDHWIGALANRSMGSPAPILRTRHNTYAVADHLANRVLNQRWTDYQIVVCDVVRRDLAKQKSFDPNRMRSIHNGVDAQQFRPGAEAREAVRTEFGFEAGHLVVGIAARLVPAKGHEFLFKAAAGLLDAYPHLRILVLGQGRLEENLRHMARNLGIADVVHWAGFRDDMHRCVQAIDIGVQPSIDCDTSSFSLKEQMAAEIPVVASDYGGLTEIVDDGVEGLIVPAGTVEPLAVALRRLMDDAGLRRTMGQAGRQRVLRDFTVEVYALRTLETYRHVIEAHREHSAHR